MKNKVRRPVEVGSKQWMRTMRAASAGLWITPTLPLAYAVPRAEWDASVKVILVMTAPWILTAVALALLSHALWRIDVNIQANPRPFTEKDARVFRRATSVAVGLSVFQIVPLFSLNSWALTKDQRETTWNSVSTTVFVMVVVSMITATLNRIHHKGMHTHESLTEAREELEKGV